MGVTPEMAEQHGVEQRFEQRFEQGFELVKTVEVQELRSKASLYRHQKTGAELLSIENDDENKVFGITFRTPVSDSTGVAHILEHSVLCGSRKYPLKDPFVELAKGSLKTFLNAFTYPDKTCYPVASQNLQDFYNLADVYLDTVLHPRLKPETFAEQGWHYELENPEDPLTYKGVVFNEMKGAFSSPDRVLFEEIRSSLYPDNTYYYCSGGDPKVMPELSYEQFKQFHETYYHPSNALIFFYGDDSPEERFRLLGRYLDEFSSRPVDAEVPLQPFIPEPRTVTCSYAAGEEAASGKRSMFSLNWLLPEAPDTQTAYARSILGHVLMGTSASPLRKALIDSGLGEDVVGGFSDYLRQPSFSAGMKGIAAEDAGRVEALVLETLRKLSDEGIDPETVEASLNTVEFSLRENNTGSFPRGLSLMVRILPQWQHEHDPFSQLAYEAPLAAIKEAALGQEGARGPSKQRQGGGYFEAMIRDLLLENRHRTAVILNPDQELAAREADAERARLDEARRGMTPAGIQQVAEQTRRLKQLQETPDPATARESIPTLGIADLDTSIRTVPLAQSSAHGVPVLYHDLFTNGIVYLDLGMDLHTLPQELIPYVSLFSRSLLEIGTEQEDFVRLTQRIGQKTGGIGRSSFTSSLRDQPGSAAWLFLRGKATLSQAPDLLKILQDILTTVRLDNQERFRQMALESRARMEASLTPGGSGYVDSRLRSGFDEASWLSETMSGISYLFFLRQLVEEVERDWTGVLGKLEQIRARLLQRGPMIANVTVDSASWEAFRPQLEGFLAALPLSPTVRVEWNPGLAARSEGLTMPSQVNFVGKAARLKETGYEPTGAGAVVLKYLRTSWLWDRVRKEGGAYGVSCGLDRYSGVFSYTSYRDPNLLGTLGVFDNTGRFLRELQLDDRELTRGIIGVISDLDQYQLPDSKGYSSMVRYLIGETDERRQEWRDQVLATTAADFRRMADVLDTVRDRGVVGVLGSEAAITQANTELGGKMAVVKVL